RHRGPRHRHRPRHSVGHRHSVPEQGRADGTARCRRACLRSIHLPVGASRLHEWMAGRIAAADRGAREQVGRYFHNEAITAATESGHRSARGYSALIPAALAIWVNRAISLWMWAANCSGEPGATSSPWAVSVAFTSALPRTLTVSALSRPTIAHGVPAGTNTR